MPSPDGPDGLRGTGGLEGPAGSAADAPPTQGALLDRLVADAPEREALVWPRRGVRWSFRALGERADAIARGLVALGIAPGERVVVWSPNRPDWVALQYALARIGAVLVTANAALAREEIRHVLRHARAAAVVAGPDGAPVVAALRAEGALPALRHAVALEGEAPAGLVALADVVRRGADVPLAEVRRRTAAAAPDDEANVQYTSGTTGLPKGVVLTHANVVGNALAVSGRLGLRDGDRVLLQVPLFHCFGCVIALLGAHARGLPLVGIDRFDPAAAWEALAAERCTVVHGVPTMYLALLDHPERPRDVRSLRVGVMGGAVCSEALLRRAGDELPCPGMVSAYGLTECSPGVTCPSPDDPLAERLTAVGRAMDGVAVRVVDPATGAPLPPGARGELETRSPFVMRGYLDDPAATAATLRPDGWLRTGDLATLDETGLVRIVGRKKELILRGGENVSPAAVEDAVRRHPAVRDAAAFGVPCDRLGEEVACAVVLRDGATLTVDELDRFLADLLAPHERPTRLLALDALPLTGSGKVQRFKLAERVANERG